MQISRDSDRDDLWSVRSDSPSERDFLEMLFSALAEKFPAPREERPIPEVVSQRIRATSNPEVALEIVTRLNLGDDSQANLSTLYEWCRSADGMNALQGVVEELVAAKVLKALYCVRDPRDGHGLDNFESREAIPSEMEDWDGNTFNVTDDDVMIVYVRDPEVFGGAE